jgi:subtilisin family serine protease
MARKTAEHKCRLFPYELTYVLSIQEAKQKAGWNITAFNLPDAWLVSQGEGVKIAVLDTGIQEDHPDINDNILPGTNIVNPGKPPIDKVGHGSHVAGIICAENNDIGVVGVAPKSKVIPVKVLGDDGTGSFLNVAAGIHWAIKQEVDLICMSLGSPRPLQQVRRAIQLADKKGIVVFVAAGNMGQSDEVFYPAAYPETIAIGSIDKDFKRSKFSSTGKNLDFMAPGGSILSTVPINWYGIMSGSSMAAPWVCGVAALLLSYARERKSKITLRTAQDYRNAFRANTIPIKDPNYAGEKFFEGFGIIVPQKLVEWASKN